MKPSRARNMRRVLALCWLPAALLVAALLLTFAWQVRPAYQIEIGNAPQDSALVRNFYGPERQSDRDGGARFRWARERGQIVLPGIGRGALHLNLSLSRSLNPSATVRVLANGGEIGQVNLTPVFQEYGFDVPAAYMHSGSLTVTLLAETYTPPGEERRLGVAVHEIRVQPAGTGFLLPPARMALSLWIGVACVALALLVAGFGRQVAAISALAVAGGMAAFLIGKCLFLALGAGGIVRAGALMLATAAAIRFLVPLAYRRLGLPTTARDVRWLALIAAATLALRFAGVLHPSIFIVDLTFHLHRFADVADKHTLLLPIQSAEFGGRTVLYAPTPYLFMLPFSWIIHDRVLLLFLFSLAIDGLRFCILWYVARRVTGDLLAANLVVLTMALMPVGWIVYSWGTFANIFAEGMLTVLFALLVLDYGRLAGPRRWQWCAVFALVICLTLLAHIGVFVLTGAVVVLYLVARVCLPPRHPSLKGRGERWRGAVLFGVAGLIAAVVAFALFYRYPAHDVLAGTTQQAVEQEGTDTAPTPAPRQYRTGGATPDDRIGLPAIITSNLGAALALETWEMSWAFYRFWPVVASIAGVFILRRSVGARVPSGQDEPHHDAAPTDAQQDEEVIGGSRLSSLPPRRREGQAGKPATTTEMDDPPYDASLPRDAALTITVWLIVAAIMLVVGIVARLYVRYPLFALPAVALGAGVALAWLVRRWRWGWIAAALLLAFSAVTTLLMWYDRIVYAFKIIV